ncbi:MAG TPA: UDP-N-acetylglucosamine 2-epimerase (non-hydrolyzing) [Acidobacteriaceae bacterium]|nr:UDP-N-acetylglucosamine 2-epimerase (non-hydrolyzing) [Acidobacteriaceae bacterium]
MKKFLHVVGARPNFMKVAPVYRSLAALGAEQVLVHTGQHYDVNMSDVFFRELEIPPPDINLQVGSGSHAQQTAEIMQRFEPVLLEQNPDCVVVYGDINSTVAAGIVCAKLLVPVAHVEAGLRSGDRTMPEEINRLLTDQIADLLFTPSVDGDANLAKEGIPASRIHFVGNVMIDTLVRMLPAARAITMSDLPEKFVLVTLHRPSNVDDIPWLTRAIALLTELSEQMPIVFPIHPRTRQRLESSGVNLEGNPNLIFSQPKPYLEFLALQTRAVAVVTDSGGIQEETTYLKVPCITVRENTERPVTVEQGSNVLVGRDLELLRVELDKVLSGKRKTTSIPDLWDGHAADRIAEILLRA